MIDTHKEDWKEIKGKLFVLRRRNQIEATIVKTLPILTAKNLSILLVLGVFYIFKCKEYQNSKDCWLVRLIVNLLNKLDTVITI